MFIQQPAPWFQKAPIVTLAAAVMVVATFVGLQQSPSPSFEGIPIPFGSANQLSASINFYGTRYGLDVYEVRFDDGKMAEWLLNDRIYLVHINGTEFVNEDVMDNVIVGLAGPDAGTDFFGYYYLDPNASAEKSARNDPVFNRRFPGLFFASALARTRAAERGEPLEDFEDERDITFLPTSASGGGIRLVKHSLFVVVVNEPGGARLHAMNSPLCGNGIVDPPEECDEGDQNGVEGGSCNEFCLYTIPIPPIAGSSSSSITSSSSVSSSSSESTGSSSSDSNSSSNSSSSSSDSNSSSSSESSQISSSVSSSSSSSGSDLQACGGSEGLLCSGTDICIDNPEDACDPLASGVDCEGFCAPLTCGNGTPEVPEECDDGDLDHYDSCNNYCRLVNVPF
ncbi:MAG: hypothetical protein ABL890_01390 [Candidatus Peribacteraceae bacterium]